MTSSDQRPRRITRGIVLGALVAAAALIAPAGAANAQEYRAFPGVYCEGSAMTVARTNGINDTHRVQKYGSTTFVKKSFTPNQTGAYQTHTFYSGIKRSSKADMETDKSYVSASHSCDN